MKDYILDFNIDMNSPCIKELVSIAIDLLSTIKDNRQKCYYTFDNGENKISEVKMNEIVVDFLMGYVTIEKYDKRRD